LVGVAVNVAVPPEHIVEELAEIATAGVTSGLTVMAIILEVAVGELGQEIVVVITQLTLSLFTSAAFE
jgi:hypothetical protein